MFKRPNRYRFLYLVRHGQYTSTPAHPDGELTELGRLQALDVASALRDTPVNRIWSSTMNRAHETACIVRDEAFGDHEVHRSWLVRERLFPGVERYDDCPTPRKGTPELLDRIAARWLRHTNRERHEVIVCHGNVIRALTTRVIGADLECWPRMMPVNGAITRIVVMGPGQYQLISYNELGHLGAGRLTIH